MNNHVKGHEVLLDSVSIVLNAGYNVNLRFVGDGVLKEKFIEKARGLKIDDKAP